MSLWSRILNTVRQNRVAREIDEEMESHLSEAAIHGRDRAEIRRSFGSALRRREESRDFRLLPWLDSLRADVVFGGRQLMKKKATSAVAILSLGLAIGACTSALSMRCCCVRCRWHTRIGCIRYTAKGQVSTASRRLSTGGRIPHSSRCAPP